jgi:DHA2 family methylenomycin A resistance protein-like MFS transporter
MMERTASGRRMGWTTLAASFGFALIQLDVTIVNVALPEIANVLGGGVADLQWVVDAYALSFAALLLSLGFLGDRLGARKVYLAGFATFAAASLGCGLAANATILVVVRALQGLGAAAMLPCSLALLTHAAAGDAERRATAIAWWTAAGSVAIAVGPIVGGLLLGFAGWRSIFLVNLPICLIGAALTFGVSQALPSTKRRTFDPLGQLLAVLALAGITGAIIEAKPLGMNLLVMALGIVGSLAAAAFVLLEQRSHDPMLPLGLFRERAFRTTILYGIVLNLTLYGAVFVLSLYLQRVLAYDAVSTGLAYLPLTSTLFIANLASGRWVSRSGSRLPMMLGAIVDAVGFGLLLLVSDRSSYWIMLPAFVLIPAGMGLGVPAMTTAVLASVRKEQSGIASGILNAARQAGGAIGVALFGALASGGSMQVVRGLHASALIAACLLATATLLAAAALPSNRPVRTLALAELRRPTSLSRCW